MDPTRNGAPGSGHGAPAAMRAPGTPVAQEYELLHFF
jgi:hypothetical protein